MGERYTTLLKRAEFLTPSEPVTYKMGGSDVLVVTSDRKSSTGVVQRLIVVQRLSHWTIDKEPGFVWLLSLSVLTAIFQVNLGYPVFIEAKDHGSGGDNWSYKSCKAPVKSSQPTNQHPFFTGQMLFLSPNSVKALKGKYHIPWTCLPQAYRGVFQLCLWPLIAPGYLGGGLPCLSSALWLLVPHRLWLLLSPFESLLASGRASGQKCCRAPEEWFINPTLDVGKSEPSWRGSVWQWIRLHLFNHKYFQEFQA